MSFTPTMAEAQAIGLCFLARQDGLPAIHNVRAAVVTMHPEPCGWCDYDLPELLNVLRTFNARRTQFEDDRWNGLPARAKGEAIRIAQGREAAV